jgi:hypothetical protein
MDRLGFSLRTVSAINEDGGGREVFLRMIPEAKKALVTPCSREKRAG